MIALNRCWSLAIPNPQLFRTNFSLATNFALITGKFMIGTQLQNFRQLGFKRESQNILLPCFFVWISTTDAGSLERSFVSVVRPELTNHVLSIRLNGSHLDVNVDKSIFVSIWFDVGVSWCRIAGVVCNCCAIRAIVLCCAHERRVNSSTKLLSS